LLLSGQMMALQFKSAACLQLSTVTFSPLFNSVGSQGLTKADLSKQYFSSFNTFDVAGIPIWATRTGWVSWKRYLHHKWADASGMPLLLHRALPPYV